MKRNESEFIGLNPPRKNTKEQTHVTMIHQIGYERKEEETKVWKKRKHEQAIKTNKKPF